MISLCLHAILEGMPLAAGHQAALTFGIALHHIPAAFALGSLLINTSLSRQKITLLLALFAIMTPLGRSEEHTSELQSLMRISYAVFCLKKKKNHNNNANIHITPN